MFETLKQLLSGRKSYLVAALIAAYAVLGFCLGKETTDSAAKLLMEALAIASLRAGIKKLE